MRSFRLLTTNRADYMREWRIAREGIKSVNRFLPHGWQYCYGCRVIKRNADFHSGRTRCKPCVLRHNPNKRTPEEQLLHTRDYQREYKRKERMTLGGIARKLFRLAIRSRRIIRPRHCSNCHKACKPHGHHTDYSRPYSVEWLCSKCHAGQHQIMNQEAANV